MIIVKRDEMDWDVYCFEVYEIIDANTYRVFTTDADYERNESIYNRWGNYLEEMRRDIVLNRDNDYEVI